MALTVETGAGLHNANSLASLAAAKTYWDRRGKDYSAHDDSKIEQALIRASDYLTYSFDWKGYRRHGRRDPQGYQALAWPRYEVYDKERIYVPHDSVPPEVIFATCECAFYELSSPSGLQPIFEPLKRIRMFKASDVSITYDVTRIDSEAAEPILLTVRNLISAFITDGDSNRLSIPALR